MEDINIMRGMEQLAIVQPSYRWAARIIDLGLWTPLAFFIFVPGVLAIDSIARGMLSGTSKGTLITLVITGAVFLFVLMVIDTLIGAIFGNTPGKSLMRISVTEQDGGSLTFSRRFKRNMGVATMGLGWSVPFLSWLLMVLQYFITRTGKAASYDEAMGFSVHKSEPMGIWRGLLCVVIFILAISFQALSNEFANEVLNPHGWYIGLEAISNAARDSGAL